MTGIANLTEDVTPQLVDKLLAVVPKVKIIGAVFNPANPSARSILGNIQIRAAHTTALVNAVELKSATDLDAVFATLMQARPDALLILPDSAILDLRERFSVLALKHRLPSFSTFPEFTDACFLVGYGTPRLDLYRRSAYYVKRVLDGTNPAELPVEQPSLTAS